MTAEAKPIRAFIAISLPEEVRQRIGAFQREWQAGLWGNGIRWTPSEQIHLTLRFLGDVPLGDVAGLEAALRQACAGVAGFELTAAGCGYFPDARRPRVLWIGVGGAVEALARLQARVVEATRAWGEIEAREFRAHLTIGRVKVVPPAVLRKRAHGVGAQTCGEMGRWFVDAVLLMRSELAPTGARHSELARIVLGS